MPEGESLTVFDWTSEYDETFLIDMLVTCHLLTLPPGL